MFIRKKINKSGSTSVQIVSKSSGISKVIKSVGCGNTDKEIAHLLTRAKAEIAEMQGRQSLFASESDTVIHNYLSNLSNSQIQVIGPELIFGKIYNHIGFNQVESNLFRHLVISRLYHPGSKLKAIDYMQRFLGINKGIDEIYRFLDRLHSKYKETIEQIAFKHTKSILGGKISIVFYDMTTLHFEASDEDDLRKTGFSKVGKHQNPQIYIGLLVGKHGYAIGYDIFEGNIFEGHTLLPVIEKYEKRYNLDKPIVVADSGLLSKKNIEMLTKHDYEYIIGARIKNESEEIRSKILSENWYEGHIASIVKDKNKRIIVSYAENRAKKDSYNRKRGLMRLEKNLKKGRLTKSNINNRGYNKYLRLEGSLHVKIDYEKYEADAKWDGLKGYITNSKLSKKQVIENYSNLWQIENAFRISKTDLRIRPIYHRLRNRIEAHICISFTAYTIYKELERILKKEQSYLSVKRAAELTHNMYQINVELPESKSQQSIILNMDKEQTDLYQIVLKYF
jgi:transposase